MVELDALSPEKRSQKYCIQEASMPEQEHTRLVAVSVRGASHNYSTISFNGTTSVPALKNFNMTVGHGEIYALLGSSGCGKTTTLRALVGQQRLQEGTLRVFGKEPRAPGSGVPGPTIGYMPQELAVYDGFTIAETLRFFGWLAGMSSGSIEKATNDLINILDLPHMNRIVGTLSGGQQRRVSFAVALLNSPPLLVLDEPTVGVDPLLRQSIWEHLLNMTRAAGTTVIITTHYIEEARLAHVVGLMRHGCMLVEDSPDRLLSHFACRSLEEVLLKLCLVQEGHQNPADLQALTDMQTKNNALALDQPMKYASTKEHVVESAQHLKALLWKNFLWMWRHYVYAPGFAAMPAIICLIYCLAIGRFPKDLPIGVVNRESNCTGYDRGAPINCESPTYLACLFIERMRDYTIQPVPYDNEESAVRDVQAGLSWGVVQFAHNFSDSLLERSSYHVSLVGEWIPAGTLENSNVQVSMDMSLQSVAHLLVRYLFLAEQDVLREFNDHCSLTPHLTVPLQMLKPVYGSHEANFLEYSLPGVIIGGVFMMGFTATMSSLLPEKTEKVLERALVSGVSMTEVLVAHFLAQLLIVVGMVAGALAVPFALFGLTQLGSMALYAGLCFCQAMAGMWLGFLLAVVCDTTTAASLVGTGCFFTFIFMSSMLWPMEGMHVVLRTVCRLLPLTTPVLALRYIALRAWDLTWPAVQAGFASTLSWALILMACTVLTIRLRF